MCPEEYYYDDGMDFEEAERVAEAFNDTIAYAFDEFCPEGQCVVAPAMAAVDAANVDQLIDAALQDEGVRGFVETARGDLQDLTGGDFPVIDSILEAENADELGQIVAQALDENAPEDGDWFGWVGSWFGW